MSEAYASSLEHVLAELGRLDLLLRVQVARAQAAVPDSPQGDAASFLEAPIGAPVWATAELPAAQRAEVQERLDAMAAEIAERTVASLQAGVGLRLVALAQLFGLAAFDMDVLLAALAPEIDRRYEQLVAYLHDDAGRPHPTVDLILNLLCPDLPTRIAARTRLATGDAPLVRHRLVRLDGGGSTPTLLGKTVVVDPRVVRFVLGDDGPDERLLPLVRLVLPSVGTDDLVVPDGLRAQLDRLVELAGSDLVVYWQGGYGVGKQAAAEAVCLALGSALLVVDGRRLAAVTVDELTALVELIDREARLQGTVVHWDDFDLLLADDKQAHLAAALRVLAAHPGPTFLAGRAAWEPRDALHDHTFVRVEVPSPDYAGRLALWHAALAGTSSADVDLPGLAAKFRLTGGQIADAAATARNLARARGPGETGRIGMTDDDLLTACRLQSTTRLAELAQKITPHFTWDDIVLPADQMALLREIHDTVAHRATVHDAWGFDRKLATGKGLNVLFAGPPGTGKTLAADVLAHALGLDLYKVDLSGVMSKYIGETEKNLARIFDEARTSNAVLFFDEADALFGKRTQVRDAHDRYANVEVSYLLQRMDDYEGVVVLATNLRKNMDEAFVRRIHFTVDLPMPGPDDRRRIWAQIWPPEAPLDPGLDLEVLAERIPVAGGSIRNIALASAFLAAADGQVVTMDHLVHATRREYQKMGKVLRPGDFGDFGNLGGDLRDRGEA